MTPYSTPLIALLLVFSLLFAGWVVSSLGIVWGLLRGAQPRAMGADPVPPPYLRDPQTRLRRRIWLLLSAATLACFGLTALLVVTV